LGILTDEECLAIDRVIRRTAQAILIGRKIVPKGPTVGFAKEEIKHYRLSEMSEARLDLSWGNFGSQDLVALTPILGNVPVLSKAFRINRRTLEAARSEGRSFDTQCIASATLRVSQLEDRLLLNGWGKTAGTYDIKGLYQSAENSEDTDLDWGTPANIATSIQKAMALLNEDNIFPPYNLILNPAQYAETLALVTGTAKTYRDLARDMIEGEIYQSSVLTAGTGMMVPVNGELYFDYVEGVDLTDETEEMDLENGHDIFGVVYECLAPRIFDANAICKMTKI